jgi:hypothetical protein
MLSKAIVFVVLIKSSFIIRQNSRSIIDQNWPKFLAKGTTAINQLIQLKGLLSKAVVFVVLIKSSFISRQNSKSIIDQNWPNHKGLISKVPDEDWNLY